MKLINHIATAGVAACLLGATAAGAIELTVASGLNETHMVEANGAGALIKCVEEKSAGDITFSYFPSGQIMSVKEGVEGLEQGLADIAFVSPSNQSARLPLNGLNLLPGLGRSSTEMVNAYRAVIEGDNPVAEEYRKLGIKVLVINALPAYQVLHDGPAITSLDDFKGMKLRAAGSSMLLTIDSVGAVPVEMAAGDMYVAMQRGTIDATILATSSVKSYALQELIQSMSRNANFGTPAQVYAISEESWAKLNESQQAVLNECSAETEANMAKLLDEENETLFVEFAEAGVEIYEMSDELLAEIDVKLKEVSDTYIARLENAGVENARAGYQAFRDALGR